MTQLKAVLFLLRENNESKYKSNIITDMYKQHSYKNNYHF